MRVPTFIAVMAVGAALMPAVAVAQTVAEEEAAILAIEQRWDEMVRARDVDGIVALYAADGQVLPPGAGLVSGAEGLQAFWTGMFANPAVSFTLSADEAHVAESMDLGYDRGTYAVSATGEDGETAQVDGGKYIVVWKKVDGEWKVAADIFNSDNAQ